MCINAVHVEVIFLLYVKHENWSWWLIGCKIIKELTKINLGNFIYEYYGDLNILLFLRLFIVWVMFVFRWVPIDVPIDVPMAVPKAVPSTVPIAVPVAVPVPFPAPALPRLWLSNPTMDKTSKESRRGKTDSSSNDVTG